MSRLLSGLFVVGPIRAWQDAACVEVARES